MKLSQLIFSFVCLLMLCAEPVLAMQISARTVGGKNYSLDVEPTDTIQNIKGKIQDVALIPADQFYLVFAGNTLKNNRTLSSYNILQGATIHILQTTLQFP